MGSGSSEGEPTLPVASVARRLGVAPSTLRTWDRRYGLGPSLHTDGRHRRYGSSDVGRLELMQRALLRGASTAEAARYALEQMPRVEAAPVVPEPAAVARPAPPSDDGEVPSRLARRLSTAALAMDVGAVQRMLADAVHELGVLAAWSGVIDPVLSALGARWRGVHAGAEVEYLLAECVYAALVRATPVLNEPRNQRPVLLACVPEERDTMPMYALSAALAGRRVGTHLFGVPLPAEVLAVTVRRSAPAAVVLWARRRAVADPRLFARVSRGRQRSRLFACGPGWDAAALPVKVELLPDLPAATDRVEHVLVGGPR
ncbi:MerR family transcriptional regulator [Amycolatopsis jiangsuensis]|uniref:DNA-binding transcriptional MerR regulator n=1 Tax=Amycolatopsis jiangsuensis TaxID=1181879 RepID=A0A840IX03_9PSEU|nr:MerR family transcriptional regulator [Amycolatopsis jiangsuensis]MBB4686390.1 DNA-binding transcriptional MerR regulator [Amycolatopsis jiangsuensis]